jgi:hypothetical protein
MDSGFLAEPSDGWSSYVVGKRDSARRRQFAEPLSARTAPSNLNFARTQIEKAHQAGQ